MLDIPFFLLYNCVTIRNKTKMTVTKNEFGQMNMFAKEPSMYMTKEDLERYGIEPYAERAQRANSRWAMIGIVAGVISYALTGNLFFGVV
jgi:exonuclease I